MSANNRKLLEQTLFNLTYTPGSAGMEAEMMREIAALSDDDLQLVITDLLGNIWRFPATARKHFDYLSGPAGIREERIFIMTYDELLKITAEKKRSAIRDLNKALKGPAGFLVKAEIKRNPGSVAWLYLAKEFCETLAEHVGEFLEQTDDIDSYEAREIGDIYMAYEDGRSDLYELLPIEAQLFTEWITKAKLPENQQLFLEGVLLWEMGILDGLYNFIIMAQTPQ